MLSKMNPDTATSSKSITEYGDVPDMEKPKKKAPKKAPKTLATADIPPFDTKKYVLGKICKRGHQWGESGQGLRYKSYRACVACVQERNKRIGGQRRADLSPEKLHLKHLRKRSRAKDRVQEPYTHEDLQKRLLAFSGECAYCGVSVTPCPHCGESRLAWNHLDRRGPDALHNLVPACRQCAASKGPKGFPDWYRKQSFYSSVREERIMEHTGNHRER